MITTAGSATEVLKESISLLSLRQYGVLMQALRKQIPCTDDTRATTGGGGAFFCGACHQKSVILERVRNTQS